MPFWSVIQFKGNKNAKRSYTKQLPYDAFRVHFVSKMDRWTDRQTDQQTYCYKQFALLSLEIYLQ